MKELSKYPGDRVFCIGGAEIYKELLPFSDKALITKVDAVYEADAYFPDLDKTEGWEITEMSEEQTCFDLVYHFITYEKK